jgi:hypothetical protein
MIDACFHHSLTHAAERYIDLLADGSILRSHDTLVLGRFSQPPHSQLGDPGIHSLLNVVCSLVCSCDVGVDGRLWELDGLGMTSS